MSDVCYDSHNVGCTLFYLHCNTETTSFTPLFENTTHHHWKHSDLAVLHFLFYHHLLCCPPLSHPLHWRCRVQTCNKYWRDLRILYFCVFFLQSCKKSIDSSSSLDTWLKSWDHEIWSTTAQTGHWLGIPIPKQLLKCFLNPWILLAPQWSSLGSSISKCMRNEWRCAPPWWRSQQGLNALELVSIHSFELSVQFRLFNFFASRALWEILSQKKKSGCKRKSTFENSSAQRNRTLTLYPLFF